jgi:ABC-2 type transport system ATP-binding protein
MDDDIAIKVDHVYKDFLLPHEKRTSVKGVFTGLIKKRNKGSEVQHALKDISFEVKKGEFFGIVGRNGSGKSTMLKILAGIYQPTKGKVKTVGKLVPFIELGVGFNPELTGRENVFLNGALLGFSKKQVQDMYDEIVEFAELERFMDQKLKNYSSGMQVRLAFSLAVRAEADILLVDEVLAVGDADFQRKCFDYFRRLKRNKKTVVFVSHDMSAVREYCDRAIFIEKNKLIMEGGANKIATAYTKMFTPVGDSGDAKEAERWGDHKIKLTKVSVMPRTAKQDDAAVVMRTEYIAKERVEHPVVGILVKSATGSHILGTNTKLKLVDTGVMEADEKRTAEWVIPNVFNDGEYFVDAAIVSEDTITTHDWWENAARFTVYREDRTPYPVNPHIEITLDK